LKQTTKLFDDVGGRMSYLFIMNLKIPSFKRNNVTLVRCKNIVLTKFDAIIYMSV
jgi:hypothetical protein